ncbi:MAG: hypothetical protein MJZ61_08570 [Bacteroidales bacterium]|nr:hypothetical protein [Bacteroidales bacterium]
MKKLFLIIVLAVLGITAKAQAVSDMAVIPIGVTLNSIARLTVTSGGNIEFVVNTMEQYKGGVAATPATTTTFSVACSQKFAVTIQADNKNMTPTTTTLTTPMPCSVVEFTPSTSATDLTLAIDAMTDLSDEAQYIIGAADAGHAAGNFQGISLAWSLAKKSDPSYYLSTFPSDRYVVNAFLKLVQVGK